MRSRLDPVRADRPGGIRRSRRSRHLRGPLPVEQDNWIARVCPSRADDQTFREWFDAAGRTGASPAVAARIYDRPDDDCVRRLEDAQKCIVVPTLVLRRPANLVGSPSRPDPVATAIPRGERVDLPGNDYHWLGDDVDVLLGGDLSFRDGRRPCFRSRFASCARWCSPIWSSRPNGLRASETGDGRTPSIVMTRPSVVRSLGKAVPRQDDGRRCASCLSVR